jgi:hypothetical protein
MKRILLWVILAAAVLAGCLLYRSRYLRNKPNVAPDALEEIEKAKRR